MQQFDCPWCGARPQTEFRYRCVAQAMPCAWPDPSREAFMQRVFLRDNAIGFQPELWQHADGCRGWLIVERHNLTHEVRAVRPAAEQDT